MVAHAEHVPHRSGLSAFVSRWLLTTIHKEIGSLYMWFAFLMFFVGGALAMGIRL